MSRHFTKYDVRWYVPNRKTPIAGSSKPASDFIVDLAKDGLTIQQIRDLFTEKKYICGYEIVPVLDAYIQRGFGNVIAREWFK